MEIIYKNTDLEAILAVLVLTIGFVAYWFVAQSPKMQRFFNEKAPSPREVQIQTDANTPLWGRRLYYVLFQRYVGVFFLGILPCFVLLIFTDKNISEYGLNLDFNNKNTLIMLYWIVGMCAVVLPTSYINAKKEDNLAMYPQIRAKIWTKMTFFYEWTSWIAYLFAYELLFRGFFLYACVRVMPASVAICVNACAYALAHLPKGQKEAVGAIPLGILFSYVTLITGNIWVAFLVHCVMALSNSIFSFYFQKEMKYKK